MNERCEKIAAIIRDYREGEIAKPNAAHVQRWITQFPDSVQEPILTEMAHVLDRSYIPKDSFRDFLKNLTKNDKLCGDDPASFWKSANFLKIQQGGRSQREILRMFDRILQKEFEFNTGNCGSKTGQYIYLDDAIFTGNRLIQDLTPWIQNSAPSQAVVHVIVPVIHAGGEWYAGNKRLPKVISDSDKKIKIHWWRALTVEDRKFYINESDVLRPTTIPADEHVQQYAETIRDPRWPVALRNGSSCGGSKIFSSGEARNLLEQQFLIAGVRIRRMCPFLPEVARPLGFHNLKTFGFGSTVVTFRNCPNNCPLVFWAGDPWYPLFPRKTNTASTLESLMEASGDDD